jgi:hypothetical protein
MKDGFIEQNDIPTMQKQAGIGVQDIIDLILKNSQ